MSKQSAFQTVPELAAQRKTVYQTALELAEGITDDEAHTLIMDWRKCTRFAAKQLLHDAREYAKSEATR